MKICKICKNTHFEEYLWTTSSTQLSHAYLRISQKIMLATISTPKEKRPNKINNSQQNLNKSKNSQQSKIENSQQQRKDITT